MKVFIGYDSRENIAYRVAKASLLKHSSIPLEVTPIVLNDMRYRGIYKREPDALAATEFSFTRFLTPYLAGYTGWALFCDCDFLFRGDIAAITDYMDGAKAMLCVPHQYAPPETVKMDGKTQHQYPRKNWSSFMFINCEHDQVRALTPEVVNTQTGMYLHRFAWLTDDVIGELPVAFNYLEGWHTKDDCPNPIAVHFTRGGPWFNEWQNVEYAAEWNAVANSLVRERDGIE
jgi:hypothetical protein